MQKIELKILIGLHKNIKMIDKMTADLAKDYGLTFSQFMVLEALYSKGDLTVGQLRDKIFSTPGTIPLIVNNLVKMGYLVRLCDKRDKRVSILHLTESGHKLIGEIVPKNIKIVEEAFSILSDSDKESLLQLIKKLGSSKTIYKRENYSK